MKRVVLVSQAHFLPRLHHIKRIVDSDVFVLLDDVQFGPHWQRRTQIKTPNGVAWLTVPTSGGQEQHVRDVKLDMAQPWQKRLMETLRHSYAHTPYFKELFPTLGLQMGGHDRLYELDRGLLFWVLGLLGNRTPVVEQSSLGRFEGLHKSDLMVALTRAVGGDVYHCGMEAFVTFYELEKFEKAGVYMLLQAWKCPGYPQPWGPFVPSLSVIDALFNVGIEGTKRLLGVDDGRGCQATGRCLCGVAREEPWNSTGAGLGFGAGSTEAIPGGVRGPTTGGT